MIARNEGEGRVVEWMGKVLTRTFRGTIYASYRSGGECTETYSISTVSLKLWQKMEKTNGYNSQLLQTFNSLHV